MVGVRHYDAARASHYPDDPAMHFSGHRAGEYEVTSWTSAPQTWIGLLRRVTILAISTVVFCALSFFLMVSF